MSIPLGGELPSRSVGTYSMLLKHLSQLLRRAHFLEQTSSISEFLTAGYAAWHLSAKRKDVWANTG